MSTGNVISSLRKLTRLTWGELFEQISVVEQTLLKEMAGDYPRLDSASRHSLRYRVEKLARRMKVTENLVASKAVELADKQCSEAVKKENYDSIPPRNVNAAYYLLDAGGQSELYQALKQCGKTGSLPEVMIKRRAASVFMQLLAISFIAALGCLSCMGRLSSHDFPSRVGVRCASASLACQRNRDCGCSLAYRTRETAV